MTVTFHLSPEIEAGIFERAQAKGLSVEDYLCQIVAREFTPKSADAIDRRNLTPEQWAKQFEEWADSFPSAKLIPDEALRRENLYSDRS